MADIKNNLTAITNPGVADDSTQIYEQGSYWFNTSTGVLWECHSASVGAAVWAPAGDGFDAWPSQTVRKSDNICGVTNSTHSANVDKMVFLPFRIGRKVTIDQMSIYLSVVGAGAEVRLGLYDTDQTTDKPGNLLLDVGTIGLSSTTGTRTKSGTLTVYPGLYWGAVGIKSTATPATLSRINAASGRFVHGSGLSDIGTTAPYRYYTAAAYVHADGFPSTAGVVSPDNGGDGIVVGLRRA